MHSPDRQWNSVGEQGEFESVIESDRIKERERMERGTNKGKIPLMTCNSNASFDTVRLANLPFSTALSILSFILRSSLDEYTST